MNSDHLDPSDQHEITRLLSVNPRVRMVRQEVVDRLRNAVLLGHLVPGQRLIERELCEWTGVSRTSVREALRQLESEGLVVHIPRRGPAVAEISMAEAIEIYDVRKTLEPRMVELFIEHATDREIEEIIQATRLLETAGAKGDPGLVSEAKTQYFDTLSRGCRNSTLKDFVASLRLRLTLVRSKYLSHTERWPESAKELKAMTRAICNRDAKAGARACRTHLELAGAAVLAAIEDDSAQTLTEQAG